MYFEKPTFATILQATGPFYMEIFNEIQPLRNRLSEYRFQKKNIGLVPTMGALHEGHIALLRSSIRANDITICSVFVNPAQFNNPDDLKNYPRQPEKDIDWLEKEGCDIVFIPEDAEMYPEEPVLKMNFGSLENRMEGKFRPGHFNGVGLVVSKLFNIVAPDRAYFGQKDLQQFMIIRRIVSDLMIPVELSCEPIIREDNGLALSSRNARLSDKQKETASALYASLKKAASSYLCGGEPDEICNELLRWLETQGVAPEYFEIVDPDTFEPVTNHFTKNVVALCVAGNVGPVRLIDNLIIEKDRKNEY